jgi:hypothetical protein
MADIAADRIDELIHRLQGYLDAGYLLHGSKQQVEVLEPRYARNSEPAYSIGKQRAIYAATNMRIPVVKALLSVKDPRIGEWFHRYVDYGDHIVVSGTNFVFTPGFVYALNHESFIEIEDDLGRRETVSYQPVIPNARVRVTPAILGRLSVRIINSAVPNDIPSL